MLIKGGLGGLVDQRPCSWLQARYPQSPPPTIVSWSTGHDPVIQHPGGASSAVLDRGRHWTKNLVERRRGESHELVVGLIGTAIHPRWSTLSSQATCSIQGLAST